jgi:predicted Zn-dependent peptidase
MSSSNPYPVTSFSLSGGLPVIARSRPGPEILAARLVIRGGSGADPQYRRGAHQLLAGTMTRGCGQLDADALADLVEGAGAALRAEAHEDSLVLGLKCAATDTPDLLPLLLAMVRRPLLAPDQVAIERQLNLQTLQRQKEDPYQLAHDQLLRLLYGEGPYGHDPLGVEGDLEAISTDLLAELAAGLGRQGAVLVLSGTLPNNLQALLESSLEGHPWPTHQPMASPAEEPTNPDQGLSASPAGDLMALEQDTEQLVLMLGCPTVPLGHPDALPLRLLQTHLGLGMSSRLFVVMREERGLAYDVGLSLPARCGAAPFVMHLSTSADRAEEATACLLEEWQRLLEEPLDPAALELARAKYIGQDAMGRQTCAQIAERLALVLSHGLPSDHVERCLARAADLDGAALQQAARRWLPQASLSLVGPASALAPATAAWQAAGGIDLSRSRSLV